MKDIPCTPGARRVKAWVAEGEHLRQDFKHSVSDAHKIARSVSAFANHSGGRLLIGVKDNGAIAGVRNEEDAYVVETAAQIYCSPAVPVAFHAYSVDTGLTVIVAQIEPVDAPPVYVLEADGTRRAYYRVADENISAHPLMVAAWERRRLDDPLVLGPAHAELLDLVTAAGAFSADVRAIALALHTAERTAAALVAEAVAAGALAFDHTPAGFILTR